MPRVRTSHAQPVSCTRRIASSRWISHDGAPRANWLALVGPRARLADREIRIHRFRAEAQRALATMDPEWRAILDAYTSGVNSGLSRLRAAPFEYTVLRQEPRQWLPEDTVLVVLSMFITLQDPDGSYEATLGTMHDVLPEAMANFLAPMGTEWDSPIVGSAQPVPPIPGPDVYDLRSRRSGKRPPRHEEPKDSTPVVRPIEQEANGSLGLIDRLLGVGKRQLGVGSWELGIDRDGSIGSNNWAVSGRLTDDGRALVANDMHSPCACRTPGIARRSSGRTPQPMTPHRLVGVTLPGVPALVVGSNTHVAWGFTNSQGDWSDIVLLEIDPERSESLPHPRRLASVRPIRGDGRVAGGAARRKRFAGRSGDRCMRAGSQGPLPRVSLGGARRRSPGQLDYSARISAHDRGGVRRGQRPRHARPELRRRRSTRGRIGWTIYGAIARRVGFDGRLPDLVGGRHARMERMARRATSIRASWIRQSGRIWTANARVVDGDMLAKLGDGNYEVGLAGAHHPRTARESGPIHRHRSPEHPAGHERRVSRRDGARCCSES